MLHSTPIRVVSPYKRSKQNAVVTVQDTDIATESTSDLANLGILHLAISLDKAKYKVAMPTERKV